jgi:type II restriction/modification system DNA methylase subunit YeeA
MNVSEFIAKWQRVQLNESAAAQQHFLDLCELLGHPKPAEADPTGTWFTFEKGAPKQSGGEGFADVWKKGFFGWEYKGRHKDLAAAYSQLLQYREALENPPLLVVCDMDRIQVHTNFTNTPVRVYEIPLSELGEPRNLEILRHVFYDCDKLKPGATSAAITADAAKRLGEIAQSMRTRGLDPHEVARFLDRIVFCLFAQDVELLPKGLFSQLVRNTQGDPSRFRRLVAQLFEAMTMGGDFGAETIKHFNGDLFGGSSVPQVAGEEIEAISAVAGLDWAAIDPSIFGTLFERGMDPSKRAQIGAHYTSREDIEVLVEPVVMQPLRREWAETRQVVQNLLATGLKKPAAGPTKALSPAAQNKARREAEALTRRFLIRLQNIKVLDPACGSGNFLYVTLQKLKDLEKEVSLFAGSNGLHGFLPAVGPWQLYGIEINPYAFELAQMTVWIGYLQWIRANGYGSPEEPVLRKMDNFKCMDAILDLSDPVNPKEPEWHAVDFIVGNPPFLGGKLLRKILGDEYVNKLFSLWEGRVPAEADLCCYWFEKARKQVEAGRCKRAGLLATQGIRGGANREALKKINETGGIFFAESDREWVLDGANVHVSMVGFDAGEDKSRMLDAKAVPLINPNLTAVADVGAACRLKSNENIAFMGATKGGQFEIPESLAIDLLGQPNPHGKPNSDVVVPWVNGMNLTKRLSGMWIIDFGVGMEEAKAAAYEAAFEYLRANAKPLRDNNARESYRRLWWQHVEARPAMRAALAPLARFLATTRVSKYRLFTWLQAPTLPDSGTFVFARSDDYFFGVLHSRIHEKWALKLGTRLETRPRYTPTTCFETFPLPEPTPDQEKAIGDAAKELNDLRNNWLNPPEWTKEEVLEFPGSINGPWVRFVHGPDQRGIGAVRYPRLVQKDAHCASQLAARTLTKLYNERPDWLEKLHRTLDAAVFAAYGWDPAMTDDQILEKLLALNLERAGPC